MPERSQWSEDTTSVTSTVATTINSTVTSTQATTAATPETPVTRLDMSFGSGEALSSSSSSDLSPLYAPALSAVSTANTQPPSASLQATVTQMVSSITQLMQQQQDQSATTQATSTTTSNPATSQLFPDLTVSGHAIGTFINFLYQISIL